MSRVLVTGASGFVGAALVPALARAGKQVRAATRTPAAVCFSREVDVVAVPDFRQSVDWGPRLADIDAVVHLAGVAHVGLKRNAGVYDRVIHRATAELAQACARTGVRRVVFVSSIRAQCGARADHVLREDDPGQPTEDYGKAKLKAEAAVRASDVASTILRPAMVYGAGVKGNLATLQRLADTSWPLPFASFTNRRSLLSLDNLLAAIAFVLDADAAVGETYVVSDPKPVTLPEIIAALRQGAGRSPRLFPVPPQGFAAGLGLIGRRDMWARIGGALVVDPSKLMAAGWRPDADTRAGLARMARARLAAAAPGTSAMV